MFIVNRANGRPNGRFDLILYPL
uniref:Uncharacterized protein n=1 Tax=Anguilla anguilla TaxID=7936 RepID=A0A0E9SQ40_ANGAN